MIPLLHEPGLTDMIDEHCARCRWLVGQILHMNTCHDDIIEERRRGTGER